jgi:hypothetical protein
MRFGWGVRGVLMLLGSRFCGSMRKGLMEEMCLL